MANLTNELRAAIEQVLSSSPYAMTSTQLFSFPEVRMHARSATRVGDCLGTLWREGRVSRLPAAASIEIGGSSRWSYLWKSTSSTLVSIHKEEEQRLEMSKTDKNSTWARYMAALKTKNQSTNHRKGSTTEQ